MDPDYKDYSDTIYVTPNGKTLVFSEPIEDNSVSRAIKLLVENPKVTRINLSTPGGSVNDTMRLISYIRERDTALDIKVMGFAYSSGTTILASATGKKIASPFSYLMYHDISNFSRPKQNTKKTYLEEAEILEFYQKNYLKAVNPKNDPVIEEFLMNAFESGKDIFINAEEALDLGLIDVIE